MHPQILFDNNVTDYGNTLDHRMKYEIESLVDDHNLCGEGPTWDWRSQRLVWTDLSASLVFDYDCQTRTRRTISRGLNAAGIALHGERDFLFAGTSGLHLWRGEDDGHALLGESAGEPFVFNDILSDSHGRLYAGTSYWNQTGMTHPGKLYLIHNDRSVQVVDEDVHLANGLGLSVDQKTLYFADSAKFRIWAYDVDENSGQLSNKHVFAQIPAEEGLPDGLTVDEQGHVWCALWYGGQVVRYDPDGHVERRLCFPVKQVTSVCFGGAELDELYVTTAAEPWPNTITPNYDGGGILGGALYRVKLDLRGRREHVARLS
jgi:sugar lactone lactonase YvrE